MTKSQIQALNVEEFERKQTDGLLTYELLFQSLIMTEDSDVCKLAHKELFDRLVNDFLKVYFNEDFFDDRRDELFNIIEVIHGCYKEDKRIQNAMVNYLASTSCERSAKRCWKYITEDDLSLDNLVTIVSHTPINLVRHQAFQEILVRIDVQNGNEYLEDDVVKKALIEIFLSCREETITYECWNHLWEFGYFEGTGLELITNCKHSKIAEYAWRRINTENLDTANLLEIAKATTSELVAHEALDILRRKA